MRHTTVQGRCPACGRDRLFVGEEGYVTCSQLDCPQPDAASRLLEMPSQLTPTGLLPSRVPAQRAPRVPFVGAAVHYASEGTPVQEDGTQKHPGRCCAATVVGVTEHPDADGTANLFVLNPPGLFFNDACPHAEDKASGAPTHPGGTWHWPEES